MAASGGNVSAGGLHRTMTSVAFLLLLVASLLPAWILACAGACLLACVSSKRRRHWRQSMASCIIVVQTVCWKVLLECCWWLRVDVVDWDLWRSKMGASGRGKVLVMNHLSFLDAIVTVALCPLIHAGSVRVLVANKVFKIPILGGIMRAMGLTEVPFKDSRDLNNLEVDKEEMNKKFLELQSHLVNGGIAAWFPEGLMNRRDPHVVEGFRAGAFNMAVAADVEIWVLSLVGTNTSWPPSTSLGGGPAQIGAKVIQVCESSHALLESSSAANGDQREKAIFLANHSRDIAQKGVDALVARGHSGHTHMKS